MTNSILFALAMLLLCCFASPASSQWDEPWCHTGSCEQSYIKDVQQVDHCKKKFRYATRSISEPTTGQVTSKDFKNARVEISDWLIADCCASTIDGEVVAAIARSTAELFKPETLRKICRTR